MDLDLLALDNPFMYTENKLLTDNSMEQGDAAINSGRISKLYDLPTYDDEQLSSTPL